MSLVWTGPTTVAGRILLVTPLSRTWSVKSGFLFLLKTHWGTLGSSRRDDMTVRTLPTSTTSVAEVRVSQVHTPRTESCLDRSSQVSINPNEIKSVEHINDEPLI